MGWYLIQFKPNAHKLAERNLTRQGFKTFIPLQEVTNRTVSGFVNVLKPLFPGYMFVNINTKSDSWQKINSTAGVSRIVTFGCTPRPLPTGFVPSLRIRCNTFGKFLSSEKLVKGKSIKLLTGPFANMIGTIDKIDSDKRIWVIMELMGQKTKLNVATENMVY